jgi:hypothetical protein
MNYYDGSNDITSLRFATVTWVRWLRCPLLSKAGDIDLTTPALNADQIEKLVEALILPNQWRILCDFSS